MTQTFDMLNHFLGERFWREDELLVRLQADIAERAPRINVSPEAGAMLATLVRASGARRVLEIGTLFGYSGVWIARALPDHGHLDTLELSDLHAQAATEWFARAGLADRVSVHLGPALETLSRLDGPYDAVFIDADKQSYPAYLDHALRVLRPGGTVIADNIYRRGALVDAEADDADSQALREFVERIANHPGLSSTVLPIGDGLSVSVLHPLKV